MYIFELFVVAALAATAAAAAEPVITSFPEARQIRNAPRQAADDCASKYGSLRRGSPAITYPGLAPWLGGEISQAVLTQTPDFNLCDEYALSATVAPPPTLAGAWSSVQAEVTAWQRDHRDEALSLASSCGAINSSWFFQFAGYALTDKAGCESLYNSYLGRVPTWPKITGAPRLTSTGVFTTVSPGGTVPTGAASGSGTAGSAAPREKGAGAMFVAAVVAAGALAVL